MSNIFIKQAENVDQNLLEAFSRLIPQLTKAPIPDVNDLKKLLASSSILVLAYLGDEHGPIVGTGTLGVFQTPSGVHAHIEDVVVDENMRGRGIGGALVSYLLESAAKMGLKGVSLTCNPNRTEANLLYQKIGFRKWETNVYWYEF